MIPRDTTIDLLATLQSCADGRLRGAAAALLAREMTARLDVSGREHRNNPQVHPAFVALADVPNEPGLEPLLRNSKAVGASTWAAGFYLHYGQGGVQYPMCVAPRPPSPMSTYQTVLTDVLAVTAQLRPRVVASIGGEPAFAVARAPFLHLFARRDWAARQDVARYAVAGTVAPGHPWQLETRNDEVAGFTAVRLTDAPEVEAAPAGDYRMHVHGSARSTVAGEIKISVRVGGVEVASLTASAAAPNEVVQLGVPQPLFAPGEGELVTVDDVVTVVNGSTSGNVKFTGVLLIWKDS